MDKKLMAATVAKDLEHVPAGEKGSKQMRFRAAYNMVRRNDLKKNSAPSRDASFYKALEAFRRAEKDPGFSPRYDKEYFRHT